MSDFLPIAVIDDDDSVRLSLDGLVRSLGYAVRTFASAEAFLAAGAGAGWACIVCDVNMPGMSGLDLQDRLKRSGVATPLILMTAYADTGTFLRAEQSGAACFLRKPFDAQRLIDCLHAALRP